MVDWLLRRKIGWMAIAVRLAGASIAVVALLVLATGGKRLIG
jgi:hypothetical protein